MSASVSWNGLDEFRQFVKDLPEDVTADAVPIVETAANSAAGDIRQQYDSHRVSGNLARGVRVSKLESRKYVAGAIVRSSAPHAWIFENGTQARHTALGWNRGSMPPGHVFIPTVIRHRRAMYQKLKGLLERFGMKVSGDA